MSRRRRKRNTKQYKQNKRDNATNTTQSPAVAFLLSDDDLCVSGYTPLDRTPEIMTACRRIAELIGSMTIHLMSNGDDGDVRIINELSRKIDIDPAPHMTRMTWMESIIMNLLLYGDGNSVVIPHTRDGLLMSMEPVPADLVSINPIDNMNYTINVGGVTYNPDDVLHFVFNPDRHYPYMGRGMRVSLRDIANDLRQAEKTTNGFLSSKYKPSLIVKVDAMDESFSSREARQKIQDEYLSTGEAGAPFIVPAEQFDIQEVKPLSLKDLAISDVVEIDKRAVASIIGVPSWLLGVGEYNQKEWNGFVEHTIRTICIGLAQEMTKKLIISPYWYLKFNTLSLMDWDIKTLSDVFGGLSDRGFVSGNEVRDRLGMSPREGLNELRILENYIPYDMSALQKKLVQLEGET